MWTGKEIKECTEYGHLFVVCRVDPDGYLCREIVWRSSRKLGFKDNKAVLCRITNKEGVVPDVGDLIFYANGEKEYSSLLKPNHLERPLKIVDFEKYVERISHERGSPNHTIPNGVG